MFSGGVSEGRLDLTRFVALTATEPARLYGLYPRKGTIAIGSDADIVLFDPDDRHVISAKTHHSNCDYTLFEGREVQGRVKKVFLRGQPVVDGNNWLGRPGRGSFVRRGEVGGF